MFGGLNSGLLVVSTVIGPLVNIDAVGSTRLFELIGFGLIAMAVAMPALLPPLPTNNPLDVDGRSAFDINGVIVISDTAPDGIIGVTGDCWGVAVTVAAAAVAGAAVAFAAPVLFEVDDDDE